MFNQITSNLKKQAKMLALMASVMAAPLARSESTTIETEDNSLQALLAQADKDFKKARGENLVQDQEKATNSASRKEIDNLMQDLDEMPKTIQKTPENTDAHKITPNEIAKELNQLAEEDKNKDDAEARLQALFRQAIEEEGLPEIEPVYQDYRAGLSQAAVEQVADLMKLLNEMPEPVPKTEDKTILPEAQPVEKIDAPSTNDMHVIETQPVEKADNSATNSVLSTETQPVVLSEPSTNVVENTPVVEQKDEVPQTETTTNATEKTTEIPVISTPIEETLTTPTTNITEQSSVETKSQNKVEEETVEPTVESNETTNIIEKAEAQSKDIPVINKKVTTTKTDQTPKSNDNSLQMILIACGIFGGMFLLQELLKMPTKQKEKAIKENKPEDIKENKKDMDSYEEEAPFIVEPPPKVNPFIGLKTKRQEKDEKAQELLKAISIDWKELSKDKSEEELHKEGIRKLGINKIKRAALRKQKKALMLEFETASTQRKEEIMSLLDEIALNSKKLSRERRQACVLIRGEQGEKEKEQRRLYAKKMAQLRRLSKKDGVDRSAEIKEIEQARLVMKEAYKQSIDQAKKEADERAQQAGYKQGLRLLNEVESEQKELDSLIYAVKKETGLKRKKEILESDAFLKTKQKKTSQKKRRALKLIKGRKFIREKIRLNKELKEAIIDHNIPLADQISEQFKIVQQEQKNCVKEAQKINYNENRIDLINPLTAQRIRDHRETVRMKLERLKKAHILRAQRMLYYLQEGKSSVVNTNQMTPQAYRQEALKLLGNSSKKVEVANYQKQRYTHLKEATLAGIYRRQKERA